MNNEQRFSERTTAFGDMVLRLMEVVERSPEIIAEWEAGKVHLFVSTDGVRLIPADQILHRPGSQ